MLNNSIHIILAEDHLVVRAGIKAMLEREPGFIVSGEASNGREVIALLENGTPADIILTDVNMPELSGMQLTEWISENRNYLKVIVLSAFDDEQYVINAIKLGASGYLLKKITPEELVFSIRHIMGSGQYICAELSSRFFMRHIINAADPVSANPTLNIEFSTREVELLRLIADGYTNLEIADKLFTSVRTIENQRQQMINKTASRNTVVMIRFAMLNGII
ncbi:MAG: response regulator transcription factor [Pedobacter sp.]|jgi:DNA-binding NarL/FixJ family response regulator|uniref:response regulator transcription factor n=1 Tax=Pedobacter sp. TaxID=1411316 RepID=UPI00339943DC